MSASANQLGDFKKQQKVHKSELWYRRCDLHVLKYFTCVSVFFFVQFCRFVLLIFFCSLSFAKDAQRGKWKRIDKKMQHANELRCRDINLIVIDKLTSWVLYNLAVQMLNLFYFFTATELICCKSRKWDDINILSLLSGTFKYGLANRF